jgi:hypothetical protein
MRHLDVTVSMVERGKSTTREQKEYFMIQHVSRHQSNIITLRSAWREADKRRPNGSASPH